jgi:hypothetical protein
VVAFKIGKNWIFLYIKPIPRFWGWVNNQILYRKIPRIRQAFHVDCGYERRGMRPQISNAAFSNDFWILSYHTQLFKCLNLLFNLDHATWHFFCGPSTIDHLKMNRCSWRHLFFFLFQFDKFKIGDILIPFISYIDPCE